MKYKTVDELLNAIENLKPFWEIEGNIIKAVIPNITYNILTEYNYTKLSRTDCVPGYTISLYTYKDIAENFIGYNNVISEYILFIPYFINNTITYRVSIFDDNSNLHKWFVINDQQAKLMIQDVLIKKDSPNMLIDYLQDISPDFRRMYELITFLNIEGQI